jgi:hypothetical protein
MSSLWTVLCLADAGRPEEALAKADAALIGREAELGRFTGMRATLLVNRMRLLLRLERPEEAYAASLAFDGAFPHRAEGALIRAHVRMAHRRPDDARRELAAWESDAAAATLDPALRLELFRVSANAFQATGDAASALRRRTAAAELSRDGEDWLRATAVALGVDVAQALIAARRATALLPQDAKAWAYRGVLETDALEADKALSRAEELVREGRTAPDFLGEELGRRAEMRGAYAAARAAYARSYERGYEPARGSAAAMEARLGRRDALAELARSGFAVAPKDPYPTLAAGYEALESGRFAEAADLAGRSLRLAAEARRPAPTNAEPLRKLALAWDRAQSLDDPETDEDQRASARAAARGERRGLTLARWRELFASEADEPLGSTRLGDLSGKADTPPAPAEPFAELALEAASDVLLALGPETPPADAAAARAFAHRLLTPVVLGATPSADLEVPRLVALLRRLRFLRSHAALAPFADPRHLDGLAPAEHVAWRRLFDRAAAAESAAAALLARTVGGRLYGEP